MFLDSAHTFNKKKVGTCLAETFVMCTIIHIDLHFNIFTSTIHVQ